MRKLSLKFLLYSTLVVLLFGCNNAANEQSDNKLYFGGDILTMENKDEPNYVEAIVENKGEIIFVGNLEEAIKSHPNAGKINLNGKTLIPGFIDSHSHITQTAVKLSTISLDPPPAGNVSSIEDLVSSLEKELEAQPEHYQKPKTWLTGWGFDNGMLTEKRFPTRKDLDKVSKDIPICIIHFSSHIIVMNSKGLEVSGYLSPEYKNPEGGSIQMENGEPNGVIEEQAAIIGLSKMGEDTTGKKGLYTGIQLPEDEMLKYLIKAQELYLSEGYTTITDFATTTTEYNYISKLGDEGKLKADISMVYYAAATTPDIVDSLYSTNYKNRYRVAGGKLNLDGGSPGRTAYLREPYYTPSPGQPDGYRGYSSIKEQKDVNSLVDSYYEKQIPFFIHALGDAAVDQCIEAVTYAEKNHGYNDARTNLIHLQQVQPDQFEKMKEQDVTLTFQNTHNFYFGDYHYEVIYGPERTERLNPMGEAYRNGFSVTFHHDSPVHPVSQIFVMWIATNRKSRSGKVYGPDQVLSPYQALYASTAEAAYQLKEDKNKGSLSVGKLADMVILNKNPLKIDKNEIKDITVLETIKEGMTVFKK